MRAKLRRVIARLPAISPGRPSSLRLIPNGSASPSKLAPGFRWSRWARLAFERGGINLFSESPPSYRGVIEPTLVKTGRAIPIFYDPGYDGRDFLVPDAVAGLPILPFHELYREVKQTMPSGELWEVYKAIITVDGLVQRVIVMPPAAPAAAVEALRSAIPR